MSGDDAFYEVVREGINDEESKIVQEIARRLNAYFRTNKIQKEFSEKNIVGNKSQIIQNIFMEEMGILGFKSEKTGLFKEYNVSALRPDYYKKINDSGIIVEVERGKTLSNNMDILDIWKCHICENAEYLFLIVPIERPNEKGKKSKVYESVCRRVDAIMQKKKRHIDIKMIYVFGY